MCAKGLDAGEGYIVGAEKRDGEAVYTPERCVFLPLAEGEPAFEQARKDGLYTLDLGGTHFVLGQESLGLAHSSNLLDRLILPFRGGPPEGDTDLVLSTMLSAVLGEPQAPGEPVAFTTHAQPVDGDTDFSVHERYWRDRLQNLGYKSHPVNRAMATIWAANPRLAQAQAPCDAVGLVFGEVAIDIAVNSRGGDLVFSLLRGMDWIDASVARMKKITVEEVRAYRETRLDLTEVDRHDPVLVTLEIYFEHQIHYALQQLMAQMAKASLNPASGLEIVAAGPGPRTKGFMKKLEKGLKKVRLPFEIVRVKASDDPLQTPAGGALLKALLLQEGRGRVPGPTGGPQQATRKKTRISEILKSASKGKPGAAAKPAAPPPQAPPAARPAPAAKAAPKPAAPTVDPGREKILLDKIRRMEARVAELEDRTFGDDADYVEELRLAAGVDASKVPRLSESDYRPFFEMMVNRGGSDLFLSAGARPAMRVDGAVTFVSNEVLTQEFCMGMVEALAAQPYRKVFNKGKKGVDLAIGINGVGRFRVNFFHQRGKLAGVFRHIKERVPSFEELALPSRTLMRLASYQRGLILVTGVAGSGKSTTIASMLEHINQTSNRHVVTIEDPIEFVFHEKQSIFDQREVGLDTDSFTTALKSAVRQSPDVIFIGEMRDRETMEASIAAAETGHLVMSTLHTTNAQQTVERIITYFPPHQHKLIRMQLSMVLVGVMSVRLLPKSGGRGRVPAVEIMLGTPTVKDLLLEGKTGELYNAISEDIHYGNQTFNQSIKNLYLAGAIDLEEALRSADNPDELKLEIRGITRGSRTADLDY